MRPITISNILAVLALAVTAVLAPVTPAHAQQLAPYSAARTVPSCESAGTVGKVVVRKNDGTERRGTLVCLSLGEVVLAAPGASWIEPMSGVRQIIKPADPIWDGALKGLALGAFIALACGSECPADEMLRATFIYVTIGTVIDASDSHREVLYGAARHRLALAGRIRF
jgi:hypothetical protein